MVDIFHTEFTSEGETIRGNFVVPSGDRPFPGICKFHGLPGSPDQLGGAATRLAEAGFAVLTFDFRGFRTSDGLFSLAGEIKDARAAITHLLESDLTVDLWAGVYGASYGGAVATCAAADDTRIKAICLRAPVYDTLWFAQSPLIGPEVDRLATTDPTQIRGIDDPEIQAEILRRMVEDARVHNPMTEISKLSPRPLLIIHGASDTAIDMAGVKRLYEKAGEPKDLVIVAGADHELTDPRTYEITMNATVEWFKKQWSNRH
jgi:dipeptidyl aminopeptidase/acylaminoacyl peptidase